MSCVGLESVWNSYAFRLGLCGIAGLEKASLGEGRGEVKGEAVDDFALLKEDGINPGGARGLTPSRGEDETGVPELPRGIGHGAGDAARRKTVCRIGGGELGFVVNSRYLHSTSKTALSREVPTRVVSFLRNSSNLSVFSSSSRLASWSKGRQSSYVSSDTMSAAAGMICDGDQRLIKLITAVRRSGDAKNDTWRKARRISVRGPGGLRKERAEMQQTRARSDNSKSQGEQRTAPGSYIVDPRSSKAIMRGDGGFK